MANFIELRTRCANKIAFDNAIKEYNNKSKLYRFFHKAPRTMELLNSKALAEEWSSEATKQMCYNNGKVMKLPYGDSVSVHIAYQSNNILLPVVMFVAYRSGCYMMSRKALCEDGTWEEWGCQYPYSECGFTFSIRDMYELDSHPEFNEAYKNFQNIMKNWK